MQPMLNPFMQDMMRSPVSGGPLWTPADITTAAWYDASDVATITEAGGAVSQWDDKSGNMLHVTQGTASLQPTTGADINGLNAIDFTGDRMETASNPFGATINDAFVIAVQEVDAVTNDTLFSLTGLESVNSTRWQAHAPWGTGTLFFDCGGISAPNRLQASYGVIAGSIVIVSFYCSTTDNVQQVYKNGTSLVADSTGHAVNTVGNIMVGGTEARQQDTTIGEFIIINGTVVTNTRQTLEGYLAWKWGLEANLPSGHPYKNSPPTV
jgi:hypothetical protein